MTQICLSNLDIFLLFLIVYHLEGYTVFLSVTSLFLLENFCGLKIIIFVFFHFSSELFLILVVVGP